MTLIVWDGKTLAADRQESSCVNSTATKLFTGGRHYGLYRRSYACALTGYSSDCLYNQRIIRDCLNGESFNGDFIDGIIVTRDDGAVSNVSTAGLIVISDTTKDKKDYKCYTLFANGALQLCEDPFIAVGNGYAVSVATGCLHTLNTLSAVNTLRAAMCDSGAAFAIKTAAQYCDGVSYACDTYYCETQTVKRHN